MCSRFEQEVAAKALASLLGFDLDVLLPSQTNVAPTQMVSVVRTSPATGQPELARLRWGLVPAWAKEMSVGNKMFNARAETVDEKPSFRKAFRARRCLIPASGFYEWKQEGGRKQPYRIGLQGRAPFAMAGLWECWQPPDAAPVESCTILTCGPNAFMRTMHDRMPVILEPAAFDRWLQPEVERVEDLKALLVPFLGAMAAEPVELSPPARLKREKDNTVPEQQMLF